MYLCIYVCAVHSLGRKLHPIMLWSGSKVLERVSKGGKSVIESFNGQYILPIFRTNLYHLSFLSLSAFQALETSTMTWSTTYQLPPNTFLTILHGNYLKLVIYGHIGFLVKVLEGDAKAVIASSGELVSSFKAKPDFTWNYFYSSTVLILIASTNSFKFTLWCKSSFIFVKRFLEVVGHVKVVTIVLFKMRTLQYLGW